MSEIKNTLCYGDNLEILQKYFKEEGIIDLIYLDPPFSSNKEYNILDRELDGTPSPAQVAAYIDTWTWNNKRELELEDIIKISEKQGLSKVIDTICGMSEFLPKDTKHNCMFAYLVMMCRRLLEFKQVLKDTGSIYLHCDPTASHYLKLVMDAVFGKENFRNEIIWSYRRYTSKSNHFQRMHDTVLYYSKNNAKCIFNEQYEKDVYPLPKLGYLSHSGPKLKDGRRSKRLLIYDKEKVDKKIKEGKIDISKYDEIIYVRNGGKTLLNDVWNINFVVGGSKERMDYPTQKPLELLERIIKASSNKGDVVMDPFMGCGTTIVKAHELNRKWIGIDITHLATARAEWRLQDKFGKIEYNTHEIPKDMYGFRKLFEKNRFEFEYAIVEFIGGIPTKKTGDGGVDGYLYFYDGGKTKKGIISVKGGEHLNPGMIRDLHGTVEDKKASMGFFITLKKPSFSTPTGLYTDTFGNTYSKYQMLTVEEILNGERFEVPQRIPIHKGDNVIKNIEVNQVKMVQKTI